ncbi:MAG: hypothetical protein WCH34_11575 [Bacteroidota bacterium]
MPAPGKWHLILESEKHHAILHDIITNNQKAIRLKIPLTKKTPKTDTLSSTIAPALLLRPLP